MADKKPSEKRGASRPPRSKKLLSILERFDVDAMRQEGKQLRTSVHAEGGTVSVLTYEECSSEQKKILDSFTFSSFRPTYALTDLHREKEAGISLVDIPPRSGIGKITIAPAPFDHVVIRVGAGNTLLITEENAWPETEGIGSVELSVGETTKIDHVLIAKESVQSRIAVRSAVLESDARLDWHPHLLAGDKRMLDIHTLLSGTGSESNLYGTYFGHGEAEYYLTYETTHRARQTKTNMLVHGCLMDRSVGIFNGQATIEQTGHEAKTFVGERCLLLGDKARHSSTPALAVNTNDVRAGHASATSQIDREQLFYAASRGLPIEEAKNLIINGFLQTMLNYIPSACRIDLPDNLLLQKP